MEIKQALNIIEESGIVLEKKLRSEMTPEELADARAKSKARRLLRKARKEGEPKKSGLSPEDSKAIAAGYKKYEDEYNDYLDDLDRRVHLKDNQTYEKQKELLDELNRKTWLFKDIRVAYKTESIYKDIKERVEKYKPKPTGRLARLDVFRRADLGDCEIADGMLKIEGRDFFFTIDPELKYNFTVFDAGPDGDEEIDFGGQFKESVLDRDPSYIYDLIRRKVDRAKDYE